MLKAFTRNYEDNSTEAGYQFTFYCDLCNNGFKSTFIESSIYKKGKSIRGLARGANILGYLAGGRLADIGYGMERGSDVLSERFTGMSPEWQKEHERAFLTAQEEARPHFHRCEACRKWVCDLDFNEEEGLCTECAPRTSVSVAKAKSYAINKNIQEAAENTTIWKGNLESKTIICPECGSPCQDAKFCNNCGASINSKKCSNCGAKLANGVKFCNQCGTKVL